MWYALREFERVLSMNVRSVGNVFVSFALSTVDIVAMQVRQFQKDHDEQARCEFERVLSINVRIISVSSWATERSAFKL